jgi:hypothetical protein
MVEALTRAVVPVAEQEEECRPWEGDKPEEDVPALDKPERGRAGPGRTGEGTCQPWISRKRTCQQWRRWGRQRSSPRPPSGTGFGSQRAGCRHRSAGPAEAGPGVMGFVAHDSSNSTNRVDACSLLEPVVCPTMEYHHEVERTIFDEIVQMKKDQTMPVFCLWW